MYSCNFMFSWNWCMRWLLPSSALDPLFGFFYTSLLNCSGLLLPGAFNVFTLRLDLLKMSWSEGCKCPIWFTGCQFWGSVWHRTQKYCGMEWIFASNSCVFWYVIGGMLLLSSIVDVSLAEMHGFWMVCRSTGLESSSIVKVAMKAPRVVCATLLSSW